MQYDLEDREHNVLLQDNNCRPATSNRIEFDHFRREAPQFLLNAPVATANTPAALSGKFVREYRIQTDLTDIGIHFAEQPRN